jgi:hypothetical protein
MSPTWRFVSNYSVRTERCAYYFTLPVFHFTPPSGLASFKFLTRIADALLCKPNAAHSNLSPSSTPTSRTLRESSSSFRAFAGQHDTAKDPRRMEVWRLQQPKGVLSQDPADVCVAYCPNRHDKLCRMFANPTPFQLSVLIAHAKSLHTNF